MILLTLVFVHIFAYNARYAHKHSRSNKKRRYTHRKTSRSLLEYDLLERVIDLVNGNQQHFPDGKGDYLIYWSVGTYLGELSECVFPIEDDRKPVDKRPVLKYGTASNKE